MSTVQADVDAVLGQVDEAATDDERRDIVAGALAETENEPIPEDGPQPTQEPGLEPVPKGAAVTPEVVLNVFRSQIGAKEEPPRSNRTKYGAWYGIASAPWCAMFVSWCFDQAGMRLPAETAKGFAFTPRGASWFKGQSRWTTTPASGHVVFFQFPGKQGHRINHVGIVERVEANGQVITIEGNTDDSGSRTGGQVMRRARRTRIAGYGIPPYGPGGTSAPAATAQSAVAAPATPIDESFLEELLMSLQEIDLRGAVNAPVQHPLLDNIQGLLLATQNPACDPGRVDGIGDRRTAEALENFQRMKGLPADRVCGKETWRALITH